MREIHAWNNGMDLCSKSFFFSNNQNQQQSEGSQSKKRN